MSKNIITLTNQYWLSEKYQSKALTDPCDSTSQESSYYLLHC